MQIKLIRLGLVKIYFFHFLFFFLLILETEFDNYRHSFRYYLFKLLEKLEDNKDELESREVKIEFAALAAAVFDTDEVPSIELQFENDLLRLEPTSLLLPKLDEPRLKLRPLLKYAFIEF